MLSGQHIFIYQLFDLDLWHDLYINKDYLLSRGIHYTKFGNLPAKGSRDIERTTYFQRPVWQYDLKSIGVMYSLWASTVPSLATFKHRGQIITGGLHFFKDQQFDLDLWSCGLEIDRGHLHVVPTGIHCTKFGNFQAN